MKRRFNCYREDKNRSIVIYDRDIHMIFNIIDKVSIQLGKLSICSYSKKMYEYRNNLVWLVYSVYLSHVVYWYCVVKLVSSSYRYHIFRLEMCLFLLTGPNTDYMLSVRAVNEYGNSEASSIKFKTGILLFLGNTYLFLDLEISCHLSFSRCS